MKYLIDPPSPFDTLKVWQEFLDEMRSVKSPDDDIRRYIQIAETEIKRRQIPNE